MYDYDYRKAMVSDILDVIDYYKDQATSMSELEDVLSEQLLTDDSVTGNASGSYWFNAYEAEEAICHNLDLLADACDEFGCNMGEVLAKGAENADVIIRCYLLGEAISMAMGKLEDLYADVEDAEDVSDLDNNKDI